jgi:hypothetical protein
MTAFTQMKAQTSNMSKLMKLSQGGWVWRGGGVSQHSQVNAWPVQGQGMGAERDAGQMEGAAWLGHQQQSP